MTTNQYQAAYAPRCTRTCRFAVAHVVLNSLLLACLPVVDFYPRNAQHIARCLPPYGVRLSVRHTQVLCINGKVYLKTFSQSGSAVILVVCLHALIFNSKGERRQRMAQNARGVEKVCYFRLKLPFTLETVRDGHG